MSISEVTRRNIIDALIAGAVDWSGRLEEPQFLNRLFDLERLPSTDHRFRSAYGDILQHRVRNYDWDDDWVFHDARFNLFHCDTDLFLQFLCEMIHPVVRTDPEEVAKLQQLFNDHLRHDGFEVTERARISGRPVFAGRAIALGEPPALEPVREAFDAADATRVLQQITRIESAVNADPELAIGTAKELVETVCRTILRERNVQVDGSPELPQLVRLTMQHLNLVPAEVPENVRGRESIQRVLSNLGSIAQGIAELRNLYGTGHGRDIAVQPIEPRHARLVAGAASTLAIYLVETHRARP